MNYIKNILFLCVFLTAFTSYSQWGSGSGNDGGESLTFGDDVTDVPIDDYIWVGISAGLLIGTTLYFRRNTKTA